MLRILTKFFGNIGFPLTFQKINKKFKRNNCVPIWASEFEAKYWRGFDPSKAHCDFQTPKMIVELLNRSRFRRTNQNRLVSIALAIATCIRSIGHRLMISYTEERWASMRVDNWRQVLILTECGGFPGGGFSLPPLQGNKIPGRNQY